MGKISATISYRKKEDVTITAKQNEDKEEYEATFQYHDSAPIAATPVYYGTSTAVAGTAADNYVQVTSVINGKTVIISYMHISNWAYEVGTTWDVAPGDLLGYVGDTGSPNDGAYHLHFQKNFNGKPGDDPRPYLPNEPNR